MKIYFAGSIRGGRQDRDVYFEIISLLKKYGQVLTEHIGNPNLLASGEKNLNDKQIHDRDMLWLKEADCLVAEVTTVSIGVGYEIAKAEEWGKPILCLYRKIEGQRISAMIAGSKIIQLKQYNSIEDLPTLFNIFLK